MNQLDTPEVSTRMAPLKLPKHVQQYTDRFGKVRRYYRRRGFPRVPLHGEPGTDAFHASYELAETGTPRLIRKPQPGFIYAVRVEGFDLVKLGYSTKPLRRLVELQNGSGMGSGLKLLGQLPARMTHEKSLHRRFARQRLFGEWFRLEGPVADWIAEIAA